VGFRLLSWVDWVGVCCFVVSTSWKYWWNLHFPSDEFMADEE